MFPSYNGKIVAGGSAARNNAAESHEESIGDVDTEEQDEPSSYQRPEVVDELSSFRQKWQRELQNSPENVPQLSPAKRKQAVEQEDTPEAIDDKAQALFLKGVQHEQDGKLYEAVKFYRQAVQLVPDIETRLYEASKAKSQPIEVELETLSLEETREQISSAEGGGVEEEDEEEGDMLLRFQRVFLRERTVCQPKFPQNSTHFSSLPMEIILYIMRWVVSSELDLRVLDLSCSSVCRGFYLAARDPEIWRLACVRVWGVNCGSLSNFESWRQMYIQRPHIHFHGCYISKTTYIRAGENSFQDQTYRPWHLVEYYRYLRFFPEGVVLMLTTSDDPSVSLRELKYRRPRNSTVLRGHYRLHEDRVSILLKRETDKTNAANNRVRSNKRKDAVWSEPSEQTFHLELQIASNRSRRHVQLLWVKYWIITHRGGSESTTKFDLIGSRFTPYHFSRVKSYTTESENVLQ